MNQWNTPVYIPRARRSWPPPAPQAPEPSWFLTAVALCVGLASFAAAALLVLP